MRCGSERNLAHLLTLFKIGTFILLLCISALALDRDAFTFTNTQLKIHLDLASHSFAASGTVTLRNDSKVPQKTAVLQVSSSLEWKTITVDGKPVQFVAHQYISDVDHTGGLSEAVVNLPREVSPQGTVTIEISYAGTGEQDSTRLERVGTPKETAAANDWDSVATDFTVLRGAGYVVWYPVALEAASLDDGDAVTSALRHLHQREKSSQLSVIFDPQPAGRIYSNGKTVGASGGKSQATLEWSGAELPFFIAADYQQVSQKRLTIHYLPGQEQIATSLLKCTADVAPFADNGSSGTAKVFALPDREAAPSLVGNSLLYSLRTDCHAAAVTLANVMSRAYFQSNRPWILEGVAQLAPALVREKQEGREVALQYMQRQLPAIQQDENENLDIARQAMPKQPVSVAYTALASANDEILYRAKAMYVWWMLRDMLGDAVVQRTLARYKSQDDTEPSYMQRLLESEAKAAHIVPKIALEQFFDDWVYRDRGLPNFKIASTYTRKLLGAPNGNNFLLTVTIQNSGNAGAEVPVTVTAGAKERVTKRIAVAANGEASLRIPLVNQPDQVTVNDGSVPEAESAGHTATAASPK